MGPKQASRHKERRKKSLQVLQRADLSVRQMQEARGPSWQLCKDLHLGKVSDYEYLMCILFGRVAWSTMKHHYILCCTIHEQESLFIF